MKIRDILKHFWISLKCAINWKDIKILISDLIDPDSWIYVSKDDTKVEKRKIEYQKQLETIGIKFQ